MQNDSIMKKLILLLFSILISFNSCAEWIEISYNDKGDYFYVDVNSIKEHNGYVYWWELGDLKNHLINKYQSTKVYNQGDCSISRYKVLDFNVYEQHMGKGMIADSFTPENPEWEYNMPGSSGIQIMDYVCDYIN